VSKRALKVPQTTASLFYMPSWVKLLMSSMLYDNSSSPTQLLWKLVYNLAWCCGMNNFYFFYKFEYIHCSANIIRINLLWWFLLYTNILPLILQLWEELENFMWQVFEWDFIRFFVHQNDSEEKFFEEYERVIGSWLNHLVDGVVHKLFGVEW
jgi:hypothetical protein